jgi:hypothetical protein
MRSRQSRIKILNWSRVKMMRPRNSWCQFKTCSYVEHQFEAGAVGAASLYGYDETIKLSSAVKTLISGATYRYNTFTIIVARRYHKKFAVAATITDQA